jgi:hypothetical protein
VHSGWITKKVQFFNKLLEDVPCDTLLPFEEDASQAAARIVREATEGKG